MTNCVDCVIISEKEEIVSWVQAVFPVFGTVVDV